MTVILEHMFHPSEMEEEATLREDLEDDIKTECTKMGPVEKVKLHQMLAMQHYCLLHSFIHVSNYGAAAFILLWHLYRAKALSTRKHSMAQDRLH